MSLKTESARKESNFFSLPPTLVASKVFSRLPGSVRQRIRAVCRDWMILIDEYYGIKVQVTDENWKWVSSNKRVVCARMSSVICKTSSSDLLVPLTRSLRYLEVIGDTTYEFLIPILKQCLNLQSLTINIPPMIPKSLSHLPVMNCFDDRVWLPNLTKCKLICSESGVENGHWNQVLFLELIFRILNTAPLEELKIIADGTDWWLPFQSMFRLQIPYTNIFSEDVCLTKAKFLPIHLLQQSVRSLNFRNDYALNISILPSELVNYKSWPKPAALQLEFVQFDIGTGRMWPATGWYQILKHQAHLKELIYEIHHPFEMRRRVLGVLRYNETLRVLKFHGSNLACHGMESFDGGWFYKLVNLEQLELLGEKSEDKIFFKKPLAMLTRPWSLPNSIRTLVVHGHIDCGRVDPGTALEHLNNLQELELMGRGSGPWFASGSKPIYEMSYDLLQNLCMSLPKLEYMKLLWIKPRRRMQDKGKAGKAKPQEQAYISEELKDICQTITSTLRIKSSTNLNGIISSYIRIWDY